jgi:hypothetical protein
VACDDEAIEDVLFGCTDEAALNYNIIAEEGDGSCLYDLANILLGNQWYISSVTADIGLEEPTDLLVLLPDLLPICTHDNVFTFFDDGSVGMDDYLVICEDDEVSLINLSGDWSIEGNQLFIQNGLDEYVLEVEVISPNEMELLFPYNFSETVIVPAKIRLVTL